MISACDAGYLLPAFHDALAASELIGIDALNELWRNLCTGECESTLDLSGRKQLEDPVLFTAANLISRGLPTLPSVPFEQYFSDTFHRTAIDPDDRGALHSRVLSAEKEFLDLFLRSLHAVIVPTDDEVLQRLGKSKAAPLLKSIIPLFRQLFGSPALQLLESDETHGYLQLPFLQPIAGIRGVRVHAVAMEGGTEQSGVQKDGWFMLVITPGGTQKLQQDIAALKVVLAPEFSPERMAMDAGALLATAEGREAMQLSLSPLGAARVHR
ncbi:MAG: hypothetical protein WC824_15075, partial [Bacteroidota bacterium]